MPENEIYASIDKAMRRLRDDLFLTRGLLKRDARLAPIAQVVNDLYDRAGYQERALRPRLGLEQVSFHLTRNETVAILEQKGVAVEETPALIFQQIEKSQELSRDLEGYFKFFNLAKVADFYRRMRFELAEITRLVENKLGPVAEAPKPAMPEQAVPIALDATPGPALYSNASRLEQALAFCPLYFILDESICDYRDPLRVAFDAVSGGVRVLQLRFKRAASRELLDLARRLRMICHERGCLLIVNDYLDIALLAGADGLHLGATDLEIQDARQLGPSLIIGVTARRVDEARAAEAEGADYLGSGSVFPSPTKPGLPVIGVSGIRRIAGNVRIPVVAIGGITLENCTGVLGAGASGFCSVSPFTAKRSVRNLVMQFRRTGRAGQAESEGAPK